MALLPSMWPLSMKSMATVGVMLKCSPRGMLMKSRMHSTASFSL